MNTSSHKDVGANTAVTGSTTIGRERMSASEDKLVAALLALGLVLAYGPTYWDLLVGRWAGSAQGHEGFVAAIQHVGSVLAAHFPVVPGDRDELANELHVLD